MSESIVVHLNGQERRLEGDALLALLELEGISPETRGVAVAVNDRVVPRARWSSARLEDGDRIELVRATQGG